MFRCLFFALAAVTTENSRRGKFAEFVSDHFLGYKNLKELFAVMHHKRMTDEIRDDRASPRPRFDRFFLPCGIEFLDLFRKFNIDIRAFFNTSAHGRTILL